MQDANATVFSVEKITFARKTMLGTNTKHTMNIHKQMLLATVLLLLPKQNVLATVDTVLVSESQVPILIERQDNVLLQMRIEGRADQVLNSVRLQFGEEVNMREISAVKLYYGGTDGVERSRTMNFSPRDYISRDDAGRTLAANRSYSVLRSEVKSPAHEVLLEGNQKLFDGVNYFWVSLQMRPTASLLSKVSVQVQSVLIDNKAAHVEQHSTVGEHFLAVGVRHAGDNGAKAYRIPGLATSNRGTLLAVHDVRYNSSDDLQEHIDIGFSRSLDGGKTWEEMRIPMSFGEHGGLPTAQNGVGDPAILVDKQTGTIWIVAAWTHGMGTTRAWNNSRQGLAVGETAQLMMVKSDDDGITWSQPINITSQVKDETWYFLLQGPGRGISMEDGTLVFAGQFIRQDRIPCACIIYSKDHGKTWNISREARSNTTEAQVAELGDGTLMLNMRDNRGGSRAVSTTTDMGMTWQEHASSRSALIEPVCMASLISVKAADNCLGKDLLLFSNPNDTKQRKNITIKASMDGGHTWKASNQLLIDAGQSWGYSCLTMIDRETVGILYESSAAHITFQAFKLTDIVREQ